MIHLSLIFIYFFERGIFSVFLSLSMSVNVLWFYDKYLAQKVFKLKENAFVF
jgi:hypothetical protein